MKRNGFTLIEVIIVSAILVMIVVGIYSAFSIGIKAWRRGSEGQDIQKIRVALLKMQKELKDSFFFSKVPFRGISTGIIFPLSMPDGDEEKVYIISYLVVEDKDTNLKKLIRRKEVFTERLEDIKESIEGSLFSASSIEFKYAYRLGDNLKGFMWQSFWDESQKNLPSAIRLSFKLKDSDEIYNKTIFIPQGAPGKQ